MTPTRITSLALALLAWPFMPAIASSVSEQETYEIAREAYTYAYPIVTMDVTMHQVTNVPDATSVLMRAPLNQFAHARTYPKADTREVVRLNFDTLYSSAWVDVGNEPMVLSVPASERYYLLPMLDMWTDVFAVVGTRTTGTGAGQYALVAEGWKGTLPDGMQKIVAPTSRFWILGRTQTNGPEDYPSVRRIQDEYTLTPLSQWGKPAVPAKAVPVDPTIDGKTAPLMQVNALDGVSVLGRLATLMKQYPPHANDYPILMRMKRIGLEPGKPFQPTDPQTVSAINQAAKDALLALTTASKKSVGLEKANGWQYAVRTVGTYGTAYDIRARATKMGLGANLPDDTVYPATYLDANGKPYSGTNRYTLHFAKGQLPPARAFWSITLYDADGFQVANPLSRFALGDRDKLKFNADGSLDIYLQNDSPGADKESNWLPTPKETFNLAMRIYSPGPQLREGSWTPPPLTQAN